MRRSLASALLLACSLSCADVAEGDRSGRSVATIEQAPAAFFERYSPGDPTTDQQAGSPGSRSSLIGTYTEGADVADDDFAMNVAAPALRAGARVLWAFGQCYSGGFVDDLARLGGDQSIYSSARHDETAAYGYGPPAGVDVDYTDAFLRALGDGNVPAERVAAAATALNPFGPNPEADRASERMGSEHAQYYATGTGAALAPARFAATGMAVLWAGQPAERDGVQMRLMIDRLVEMGYARDRIWFLYGGGVADEDHPVVRGHVANQAPPVNFRAATRKQLVSLFAQSFAADARQRPDFVFFYVGDHGGLNGAMVAKRHFGRPDPLVAPNLSLAGRRLHGAGDADL
jgi:hypothetical protein